MTSNIDTQKLLLEFVLKQVPTVLYGPPGTGKTRHIELLESKLNELNVLRSSTTVQFHRKFSYEDFIEGFAPTEKGFERKNGVFKNFCLNVNKGLGGLDLFVIDEFNRADVATTFGEVLYALENRSQRKVLTAHFNDEFQIPETLSLVATMNTADKSISQVDFAVRRRFQFIPVFPSAENLTSWLGSLAVELSDFSIHEYVSFFRRTNMRILKHPLLGGHMQLGEAFFVPANASSITETSLTLNFVNAILPQIESYLGFGNVKELANIFNPAIAAAFVEERWVDETFFTGIIREAKTDVSFE